MNCGSSAKWYLQVVLRLLFAAQGSQMKVSGDNQLTRQASGDNIYQCLRQFHCQFEHMQNETYVC